jgi:hypothetical protein
MSEKCKIYEWNNDCAALEGGGDEDWYWSNEWQAGMKEALEDIREGRTTKFNSIEELRAHLFSD